MEIRAVCGDDLALCLPVVHLDGNNERHIYRDYLSELPLIFHLQTHLIRLQILINFTNRKFTNIPIR